VTHFSNAYADPRRADSYASLAFPGTYALAFRDLPTVFATHVDGHRALDFGCGAGRSTRFMRDLGFEAVGVDIAAPMVERARTLDREPGARDRYTLIDDDPSAIPPGPFDLILAAYPFDNIPDRGHRAALLEGLRRRLAPSGRLVLLASSPELYVHEWVTFTTAAYPENATAGSGDPVRIAIKEGGDPRPVQDLRWFDQDYRDAFRQAGLEVLEVHRPLATGAEPVEWISETEVAPWVIYVTGAAPVPKRPAARRF
jgi:SAM-dependent methyltransferase